ncbi:unnamed protein product [Rotaria sp. Silwood1]|nr:unnamed protein product [Rotaria sp. Silwood1]
MNIITIFFTVVIINYNYRTPRTHKMPYWIRRICIDILPRILPSPIMMNNNNHTNSKNYNDQQFELKQRHSSKKKQHHHHHYRHTSKRRHPQQQQQENINQSQPTTDDDENNLTIQEVDILLTKEAYEAAEDLNFTANHMQSACHYEGIRDDWKYIASVIDRLKLFIFFAVTAAGTLKILFDAPDILKGGVTVQRAFCGNCDGPICSTTPSLPGVQIVKLGLFDEIPKPSMEVYCKTRRSWNKPVNGAKQFDTVPTK